MLCTSAFGWTLGLFGLGFVLLSFFGAAAKIWDEIAVTIGLKGMAGATGLPEAHWLEAFGQVLKELRLSPTWIACLVVGLVLLAATAGLEFGACHA